MSTPTHAQPRPRIRAFAVGVETWWAVRPLIPPLPQHGGRGRPPMDDRTVLAGILTILASGIGFEALPAELGYGSGMTCWRRLRHWQQTGAWPAIALRLREVLPPEAGVDLDRVDRLFHGSRRHPSQSGNPKPGGRA